MIFIVIDEEEHYEIHPLSASGSLKIKKVIIKEPPIPVISKPLKEQTVLTKELAKI
jgi:hypothetical protein